MLEMLQSRGIVVFGADLWASDWERMTPEQELKLITDRSAPPERALSCFTTPRRRPPPCCRLSALSADNQYRVVHMVAAAHAAKKAHEPRFLNPNMPEDNH